MCTINICTSSVPSFCSFCEIMKTIIQLLCFETNNIFKQASKPSYSVKPKYRTRLGRIRCRRLPRIKSNHAMPQCIDRNILEIMYPTRLTASLHRKKKVYIIFAKENILQNH